MVARIARYRRDPAPDPRGGYAIGCLMISLPVFFPPGQWVAEPPDWAPSIVQGKTLDVSHGEGARILANCLERRWADEPPEPPGERPRYGDPALIRPRLGQGTLKLAVVDAYAGACAVTTEHSLPVLEAAHFAEGGPHDVANGLLLRRDIHRLFDRGYVTVTPGGRCRSTRSRAARLAQRGGVQRLTGARRGDRPTPTRSRCSGRPAG